LNLKAMYADHVHVMEGGRVAASGSPGEVLTDSLISKVFDCALKVGVVPPAGMPFVLPQSAA
jgi:iron complex transport system ATP-binding protein